MQIVDIKNFDVLDILQDFRYTFMIKYDVTKTNTFINDDRNSDYWCGDEFLNSIKLNHDGSPDAARSYCLKPDHYEGDEKTDYCLDYISLDSRLKTELGVQYSALSQLYPPGGYIAWHTNENACAYNLIFTYSETGDGYFEYIDPKTGDKIMLFNPLTTNLKTTKDATLRASANQKSTGTPIKKGQSLGKGSAVAFSNPYLYIYLPNKKKWIWSKVVAKASSSFTGGEEEIWAGFDDNFDITFK